MIRGGGLRRGFGETFNAKTPRREDAKDYRQNCHERHNGENAKRKTQNWRRVVFCVLSFEF